jgi:hypothetical protein
MRHHVLGSNASLFECSTKALCFFRLYTSPLAVEFRGRGKDLQRPSPSRPRAERRHVNAAIVYRMHAN